MSLHDVIDEVFYELDPIRDEPIDYVSCIDLKPIAKRAWATHTNDRAMLASLVSVCTHCTDNLRFCARLLAERYHVSLRRLEDYSRYCGFVLRTVRGWIGYGKLVEATLYYYYQSPRRKRWSRHIEIRLYFTIPIHVTSYDTLLKVILEDLDLIARMIVEHWYGVELANNLELDEDESIKHGIRIVTKDYIEMVEQYVSNLCPLVYEIKTDAVHAPCCLTEYWCNDVVRSSYDFIQAIVIDYRKKYAGRKNYCYEFDKKELTFVNIRYFIERWFRWW